jgi:hypothetical protein
MDFRQALADGHSPEDVMQELSGRGVSMDYKQALADGHNPLDIVSEMGRRLETPPPSEKRSALGEIWSQLKAGAFVDLPRIAGKAMQYVSEPGNGMYETGKGLVEDAHAIESLPEMQPGDVTGRPVVSSLSQGARMVPAAAGAAGAAALMSTVGLPETVVGIGGAALAAVPFALSKAQETYEKGLQKHGITPEQAVDIPDDLRVQEALNASRLTGGVEFAANTAGGTLSNRLIGVGGKFTGPIVGKLLGQGERSAAQGVLQRFASPEAVARFGLNTLETGGEQLLTQAGRAAAEAGIENAYGYSDQNPVDAAKEMVSPTLGMTAIMAPLGIPARMAHSRHAAEVVHALGNAEMPPEIRAHTAEIIYDQLAKESPEAANNFAAHAFDAIHGNEETGSAPYGLALDDNVIGPMTPRIFSDKQVNPGGELSSGQAEPSGPLSRAISKAAPIVGTDMLADHAGTELASGLHPLAPEEALVNDHIPPVNHLESMDFRQALADGHSPEDVMQELSGRGVSMDYKQALADGHNPLDIVSEMGRRLETPKEEPTPPAVADIPASSLSRATVESAFPRQNVSEHPEGFTVALKNGQNIKVTPTREIYLDTESAARAHHREISHDESPVASFQRLDPAGVISLIEQGGGQIHHEAFHAAMRMALNDNQKAKIIKRFGSEEAAAGEYQRLKDSGAFEKKQGHLYLQTINRFFQRVQNILNPSHEIMETVSSGGVWEQAPETKPGLNSFQQARFDFLTRKAQSGETLNSLEHTQINRLLEIKEQGGAISGYQAEPVYSFGETAKKVRQAGEKISSFADKSTFVKQDVRPALNAVGEGLSASWDGIKAAVNPMARTPEAEQAGRILIEGMGKMEHGKEQFVANLNKAVLEQGKATTLMAKALDLMKTSATVADKLLAGMPEAERIEFMQRMDTGEMQRTPELQRIAGAISTMFEEKAAKIQSLGTGVLEQLRENYFPHLWARGADAGKEINTRLSKRPLEGPKEFSKARVFEDINAGLEAGFQLLDTNPINLVFLKMAEMDKYINTHVTLQAMEESGLVHLIPAGDRMPSGYSDISGKYGLVTKRTYQDPETGMPGEETSYRYVAREDVAQVFNNYLSQNLYNNKYIGKPFKAYMGAANTLNQFQLGVLSAFHAGFTSMEAVISHGALGVKALSRGDVKEAVKYFKQAPAAWLLNPKLGDKVLRAWMGDEQAAREMPQIVQWLEMAGARRIMDKRFQTNQTEKMFQAWSDGNHFGAGLRTIPAFVEQSARPIMEWLVPRQKFGVFAEMANDWNQHNLTASHEETRTAMQQIWNRVDSRLGQVVYDRLFVHNIAKNLTQAIIRAPGWTGGTILEVGGGFKDLAGYFKDVSSKGFKSAELSDRAAYTLSLLATTAAANAVLTALFTGDAPNDWKDLIAFRTGNKDEHGNPERFMLPTYMKDIYAYAQQPGTTLMHKTHPLISMIGDLARNKDYYGVEIRHQGDNPVMQLAQAGEFTAKAFIPFWMKGAAKEYERGGSVVGMAAPLVGVMPAPADMNKTKAERLASELLHSRIPTGAKTAEQFEHSQLIMHLTGLKRSDRQEALAEIKQALNERKINLKDAQLISQNAKLAPIQVAFKHLSYEEAQKVFEEANEGEKKKLGPMMAQKRYRHNKG